MVLLYTTAIRKLQTLKKRKRIIQGGTSAGKTFGIIPILIDIATREPHLEISIVAESIPHLRRGAYKDFEKIMKVTKRWCESRFNRSLFKYTFANGSYIEFFSVDQPDKLRGARRNILYVNEANNISYDAYRQLEIRTDGIIYLDFNPTSEFWCHTEMKDDEDAEWLILTYKDNEALSDTIVKEVEKAREKAKKDPYWANWWKVYGLGQLGSLQGAVIPTWNEIEDIPEEARLLGYGLDFGYNDPTAIVSLYKWNNSYIFDEVYYKSKVTNRDIAKVLKRSRALVVADCAEPKSIQDIRNQGVKIKASTKGKDSIMYGVNKLNENSILVTQRSSNLIKELRNYVYKTDKSGSSLNIPIDDWNHCIDAMRYIFVECVKPRRKKKRRKIVSFNWS